MSPRLRYPDPFDADTYYYVPMSWLAMIQDIRALDVGESLLSMLADTVVDDLPPDIADGCIELDDEIRELLAHDHVGRIARYWTMPDQARLLPALCSRVSYADGRDLVVFDPARTPAMVESMLFTRYITGERPSAPGDVDCTLAELRALCQKYRDERSFIAAAMLNWPPDVQALVYIPRGYMHYRWSVWFGESAPGMRAARLGLCVLVSQTQDLNRTFTKDEITDAALNLLPGLANAGIPPAYHIDRAKVADGLDHLAILGIVEQQGQGYSFVPEVFGERPRCVTQNMARFLVDKNCSVVNENMVALVSDIIDHRHKQLDGLGKLVETFNWHIKHSEWFRLPTDFDGFRNNLADQRPTLGEKRRSKLESVEEMLKQYLNASSRPGHRVISEQFDVVLAPDARVQNTRNSATLKVDNALRNAKPQTIHILLDLGRKSQDAAQQTYEVLKGFALVIHQVIVQEGISTLKVVTLKLANLVAKISDYDTYLQVDGNELNREIDFRHPFQMMLVGQLPRGYHFAARELHCRVLLYYPRQNPNH